MIEVKLFCDWQTTEELTENIIKDFRETLQISSDNIYKDIWFVVGANYDVGIHLNNINSEFMLNSHQVKNVVVAMEPPELLNINQTTLLDKYFLPDMSIKGVFYRETVYYPLLWTLHAKIDNRDIAPSQKSKKMSCIMSNKGMTSTHLKRLQIVHSIFCQPVSRHIDFYGAAFSCRFNNKADGLRNYSYSIAFENSLQKGVLTEKFYDCIVNNTIPITNNKTAFDLFDKSCFVYIDFNNSIEEIIEQISNILISPILPEQDIAIKEAKQNICYGERNIVHDIYNIVHTIV